MTGGNPPQHPANSRPSMQLSGGENLWELWDWLSTLGRESLYFHAMEREFCASRASARIRNHNRTEIHGTQTEDRAPKTDGTRKKPVVELAAGSHRHFPLDR